MVLPEMLISYPEMLIMYLDYRDIVSRDAQYTTTDVHYILVMVIMYLVSRDIVFRDAQYTPRDAHHVYRLQISYTEMLNIKPEMLKYF